MKRRGRGHVHHHMAVEQPVPRALRRPCHFEHVAGLDELGHALTLLLLGVTLVVFSVSNGIDREIETVKCITYGSSEVLITRQ